MGTAGWHVVSGGLTPLQGTLESVEFSTYAVLPGDHLGDLDWNLNVRPSPSFQGLLQAPGQPFPNQNGIVQCEVQPIPPFDSEETMHQSFDRFIGRSISIVGTWVQDLSHSFDGSQSFISVGSNGKTEIHPINLVVIHDPQGTPAPASVYVWAFSEASLLRPSPVPGAGDSVTVVFTADFPTPEPDGPNTPRFTVLAEADRADSHSFSLNPRGDKLMGTITTGQPFRFPVNPFGSPQKGYYSAQIELDFTGPPLHATCSPSPLTLGVPQTFTVHLTEPVVGNVYAAAVGLSGGLEHEVFLGKTGQSLQHTFRPEVAPRTMMARRGGTLSVLRPQVWVRAGGYLPATNIVPFVGLPQNTPKSLDTKCSKSLKIGLSETFKIQATDAMSHQVVSGEVWTGPTHLGKTDANLTHTFQRVSTHVPHMGQGGHGGGYGGLPPGTVTIPPTITVKASGYPDATVHVTWT
jgi:hypothetical protein